MMKRNIAESSSAPPPPPPPPTKSHKKTNKDPVAKKHASYKNHNHNKSAVEAASPVPVPVQAVVEVPCNAHVEEVMGGESQYCRWWGVEEEVLLGWFPFVEEHFVWSMCRGGGGVDEDEEEDQEDYDIWQLRHIHEIPNTTNN